MTSSVQVVAIFYNKNIEIELILLYYSNHQTKKKIYKKSDL